MIIEWFCQCSDLSVVVILSLIVNFLLSRVLHIHSDLCFVGQFVHENIIL